MALSACSNTLAGIKADARGPGDTRPPPANSAAWAGLKMDVQDISDWAHSKPSALQETLGPVPTAYAGEKNKSNGTQWKLPGMAEAGSSAGEFQSGSGAPPSEAVVNPENGPAWEDIGEYDVVSPGEHVGKTGEISPEPAARGDVVVYPVDGSAELENAPAKEMATPSGKMVQQIFFDYGSARVGSEDRQELRTLAAGLRAAGEYQVNVIGHASPRVDHVDDPLRRKMINFEMARKRALAVTMELRRAGVKPGSVMATSEGEAVPNPDPAGKDQEAADRRAEVYVDNQ